MLSRFQYTALVLTALLVFPVACKKQENTADGPNDKGEFASTVTYETPKELADGLVALLKKEGAKYDDMDVDGKKAFLRKLGRFYHPPFDEMYKIHSLSLEREHILHVIGENIRQQFPKKPMSWLPTKRKTSSRCTKSFFIGNSGRLTYTEGGSTPTATSPQVRSGGHSPGESQISGVLRTLYTAQQQFRILKKKVVDNRPVYGTFNDLVKHDMIDKKWVTGAYKGQTRYYDFKLVLKNNGTKLEVVATPRPHVDTGVDVAVEKIEVDGDTAVVRLDGYGGMNFFLSNKLTLKKVDGTWKIAEIGGSTRGLSNSEYMDLLLENLGELERIFDEERKALEKLSDKVVSGNVDLSQVRREFSRVNGTTMRKYRQLQIKLMRRDEKRPRPTLRRSRKLAQESSAIGALRTIVTSQQQFRILKKKVVDNRPVYGTFDDLVKHDMIDAVFADKGEKSGYKFYLKLLQGGRRFEVVAVPVDGKGRSFYTNNTGRVTQTTDGSQPNADSPGVH